MNVRFTEPFLQNFRKLPPSVKGKFEKQMIFLAQNLRHPSLRAKKYNEEQDIWQARADKSYRFYFQIKQETYIILNIIKHPK